MMDLGQREVFTWTGLTLQVDVLFRFLCRAWYLREGGRAVWDAGFGK